VTAVVVAEIGATVAYFRDVVCEATEDYPGYSCYYIVYLNTLLSLGFFPEDILIKFELSHSCYFKFI